MPENTESEEGSQQLGEVYNRHLAKTAIKSLFWIFVAYVVTYFFPEQKWVWYLVFALIAIAIGFAVFIKVMEKKSQ